MKKSHDAVYVERYTDRNGAEKKRYTNIGSLLVRDDGSMALKLEAIPVNFSGWVAFYEPKPKEGARESSPSRSSGGSQAGDPNDEIPFSPRCTRRTWWMG